MPRIARQESDTLYYHVMTRGINKEKIFKTDNDKKKILKTLEVKLKDSECELIAYCIMDNHLHLALKAEMDELISLMKKINISYAMYYNKKNDRLGPVFQDRFKSENIHDESYLFGLIRYIHNNPVDANVTRLPDSYKWSSMNEYLKEEPVLIGSDMMDYILGEFGSRDSFREFHDREEELGFLEIKEHEKIRQDKRVEGIIRSFFKEKGVVDSKDIKEKDELIIRLIDEGLPYRNIAELTNSSLNSVYQANKKNRPQCSDVLESEELME